MKMRMSCFSEPAEAAVVINTSTAAAKKPRQLALPGRSILTHLRNDYTPTSLRLTTAFEGAGGPLQSQRDKPLEAGGKSKIVHTVYVIVDLTGSTLAPDQLDAMQDGRNERQANCGQNTGNLGCSWCSKHRSMFTRSIRFKTN